MTPLAASGLMWAAWALSWLLAAGWSRRTAAKPPFWQELSHRAPAALAGVLMALSVRYRYTLGAPSLWPLPPAAGWALTLAEAAGFAFCWWARITLGDLWSGSVTRKDGHVVVERGPYALVRHPIYTGLLLAAFALALQIGRPIAVAAAVCLTFSFWLKGRIEERFLSAELGEAAYADYRRRVPMLVPFWPVGR